MWRIAKETTYTKIQLRYFQNFVIQMIWASWWIHKTRSSADVISNSYFETYTTTIIWYLSTISVGEQVTGTANAALVVTCVHNWRECYISEVSGGKKEAFFPHPSSLNPWFRGCMNLPCYFKSKMVLSNSKFFGLLLLPPVCFVYLNGLATLEQQYLKACVERSQHLIRNDRFQQKLLIMLPQDRPPGRESLEPLLCQFHDASVCKLQ